MLQAWGGRPVGEPPHYTNEPSRDLIAHGLSVDSIATAPPPPVVEPPGRRGPWGLIRGILARAIRFAARHRFVGCLGLLLGLLVLCGAVSVAISRLAPGSRDLAPVEQAEVNQIGTVVNDSLDPVDSYIEAMTNFDAQGMWDAYASSAQAQMSARGQTIQQLQQGLDRARAAGARINDAEQIGNYPLRDGRRYVFYIVSRSGFPPGGGDEELYFIFTTDPSGHILNVT